MKKQIRSMMLLLAGALCLAALLLLPSLLTQQAIAGSMGEAVSQETLAEVFDRPAQTVEVATELPWAMASPAPQEEARVTIPPTPVATLLPTQSQPLDAVMVTPLFEFAAPNPTPQAQPGGETGLLPLDWRMLLHPVGEGALSEYPAANITSTDAPVSVRSINLSPSLYVDELSGQLLIERFQSADLAEQKLINGMLGNLKQPTIYIPAQEVFDRIGPLSIEAVFTDKQGNRAELLGNMRHLMTIHVLEQARQINKQFLTPQEYQDLRDGLCRQAASGLEGDPQMALEKSLALIQVLMNDDKAGQYSVINAQSYTCQRDWEFFVSGHHISTVEMSTGKLYTFTTDILSNRIIGIAHEGAEPWLARYDELMQRARRDLGQGSVADRDRITAMGREMIGRLAGIAMEEPPPMMIEKIYWNSQGRLQPYWSLRMLPKDEEAQRLDATGAPFRAYELTLDMDERLRTWDGAYTNYARYEQAFVGLKELDDPNARLQALQRLSGDVDAESRAMLGDILRSLGENQDNLRQEVQQLIDLAGLDLSLLSVDRGILNAFQRKDGGWDLSVWINAELSDAKGHRYSAAIDYSPNQAPYLSSLIQSDLPDGSEGEPIAPYVTQ